MLDVLYRNWNKTVTIHISTQSGPTVDISSDSFKASLAYSFSLARRCSRS